MLCLARGQRSEARTRCWLSVGEDACGRDDAALSAHRSLCACFCVVFHPLSHLCYQHTPVSGFPLPSTCSSPEPMSRPWRPSPLALMFSSRSPSPRGPPEGRVLARALCAPHCCRQVRPGQAFRALPALPLSGSPPLPAFLHVGSGS